MKPLLIAAVIAFFFACPQSSAGQPSCMVTVAASIEVASSGFSLADLLSQDTCPALQQAAAGVRLGGPPLAGSVRVLLGDEVRALFQRLVGSMDDGSASAILRVPERISVRRAGRRASCADIGSKILASEPDAENASLQAPDCGAAGGIAQDTLLEPSKIVWDPTLKSWNLFTRCVHPEDCVPFWVRVSRSELPPELASFASRLSAIPKGTGPPSSTVRAMLRVTDEKPLIRPGEAVSLLWDEGGIRLTVPAISLDAGVPGQAVRARLSRGGRMVRAIVVSAGKVRAAS
jgi:hypothetical protein